MSTALTTRPPALPCWRFGAWLWDRWFETLCGLSLLSVIVIGLNLHDVSFPTNVVMEHYNAVASADQSIQNSLIFIFQSALNIARGSIASGTRANQHMKAVPLFQRLPACEYDTIWPLSICLWLFLMALFQGIGVVHCKVWPLLFYGKSQNI